MIKSNKIRLLKAVALGTTLGALFSNGSIGTEDDKREKENKAGFKLEREGDHADVALRVQEILKGVEERNAIRRDLFRQPRTFDLSAMPINDVFNHLYGAYEASDNGAHLVKVKALTLLNITQEQLNQILSHENAGHIEELNWTYQTPLVDDMAAYDLGEEPKNTSLKPLVQEGSEMGSDLTVSLTKQLLDQVDERAKLRRELLQKPRTIDLGVKPVGEVFEFLHNAHKYSGNDPIKVKLDLHNVTEGQLDKILNHEYAGHIEALNWAYQPVLVAMTQETETDTNDADENLARDSHQAQFVPALMQIIVRKEDPSKGLKPVVRQEERGRDRDREIRVSAAQQLLDQMDERTRHRQDILRQPRTIDLGVKPINNVLNVLYNARKYSDQTPIKVKLNLHNVTKEQLNRVLNDENANHIGELDWTYQPALVDVWQDAHQVSFIPALMEIMGRSNQPLNGLNPVLYQEIRAEGEGGYDYGGYDYGGYDYGGYDYIDGLDDGAYQPVVAVEDRQEDGENIDNVVAEEGVADDEIAEEGDLVALDNDVRGLRRAVARRRDAPALPELEEVFEQENNLEPVGELIANDGEIGEVRPAEDDVTPIISASSWNITPINEDTINPILQNLGSSNTQARQASQNLVNIYCRHVPGMVAAH